MAKNDEEKKVKEEIKTHQAEEEAKPQEATQENLEEQKQEQKETQEPQEEKKQPMVTYPLFMIYDDSAIVSEEDVITLLEQLNKIPTPPNQTRIDLILLTIGGFPHPAYQIVNILRSKCAKLKVIVPLYAKSAGTLVALGADEIVMGPQSELGPLDMQMEHPLIENLHISALEGYSPFFQIYSQFATQFYSFALEMAGKIVRTTGVKREDGVALAFQATNDYLEPIVAQINPTVVSMCYRALETGETYAYNLLSKYMYKSRPEREREYYAKETARALVWNYQSHGQVIDRKEAIDLNLYISFSNNYPLFDVFYGISKETFALLNSTQQSKVIRLLYMEQLERLLSLNQYIDYLIFMAFRPFSFIENLNKVLEGVADQQIISITIKEIVEKMGEDLKNIPDAQKQEIKSFTEEVLQDMYLKNITKENAVYKAILKKIEKDHSFSKKVAEVIADRIRTAAAELAETFEIAIDRTPPEIVDKYILQILAFLLTYNIRF